MSETNGHGEILSGDQVMAKGRRRLLLPSGGTVIVGRLEIDDLTEALGGLPDVTVLETARAEDSVATARRPEARAIIGKMASVIRKGTIEPELFEKRKDGPTPLDFTLEDRALMFKTILELSSYSKATAAAVLPLSETAA